MGRVPMAHAELSYNYSQRWCHVRRQHVSASQMFGLSIVKAPVPQLVIKDPCESKTGSRATFYLEKPPVNALSNADMQWAAHLTWLVSCQAPSA